MILGQVDFVGQAEGPVPQTLAQSTSRQMFQPGVDNHIAIFLAMASSELDVMGLTTIFGHGHTELATTTALRLLEIEGRIEMPVARGGTIRPRER